MQPKQDQTSNGKRKIDVDHLNPEEMSKRKRARPSDGENEEKPAKKTKRGPWTDNEHNALLGFLVERRHFEKDTGAKKLNDDKLWRVISEKMIEAGFDEKGGRTSNACRMYWQRRGRELAGYDERDGVFKGGLKSTSLQGKRAKKNGAKDED